MKQAILILIVLIAPYSCKKETEDGSTYHPGRLTGLSYEDYSSGLIYHKYKYTDDNVTDLYYYSSPKIFISKYHFNENLLRKVYYSFENTSMEYFQTDSLTYNYADTLVTETYYFEGEISHKDYYAVKNGKIISSLWNGTKKSWDYYYEWKGDNLIRIERQWWYGVPLTANTTEYVFEYADIENPFYVGNIPRLMKEFNNPYNHNDELSDLIPTCSRNFPQKLTITVDGPGWEEPTIIGNYSFECKTFPNANKPYKVRMTDTAYGERQVDYFLTYEEL